MMSHMIATQLSGVSYDDVFNRLMQREQLGSTGIGLGIAIPHGRHSDASHPVAALMTLATPIDFDAIDNQPVDIIFVLLVPEQEPETHLQTLSAVAEQLDNREWCAKLRAAQSDDELYHLFIGTEVSCS